MISRLFSRLLLLALAVSSAACADENSVRKELASRFPDIVVSSVKKAPVKGLYEVTAGQQVFYVDENVDHVILGNIIDSRSKRNLTAERRDALLRVDFASLPFDDAITIVKGTGSRKLAVFEDPDCPYCRRLEAELAKIDDVTLYIFLLPLDQLHPEAGLKARKVWCAPDRAQAWLAVMNHGKLPDNKGDCPNPVARTAQLAQELNIEGTPALIFESGRLVPGAIPRDKIEALLNEGKAAKGGSGK
ncbi:DsbC family protein [Thiobacter aerophilum]|uniref:Thiol:disulfide interchange protein n=1 Tax=Thiobacter aerophilum TaxID=3121275 RepID=A0ABV0EIF8_9BURK